MRITIRGRTANSASLPLPHVPVRRASLEDVPYSRGVRGGRNGFSQSLVGCGADFIGELLIDSSRCPGRPRQSQFRKRNGSRRSEALPPGSTAIDGWTVVGSNVSYVGGRWKAADGLRSVGLLCGGGISQTFQTEPDQKYEVRFNMAGDPNTLPAVKSLAVSFGTEDRAFTFDTTGRSPGNMGWEARFWIFTASDTTTAITFLSPKTECSTPAVDNVRVTAVEIGVQAHPDDVERRYARQS